MKPLVAIVGRPNVGKSMLFNKLIGQRLSIVEDTPGVTRDRIYGESEWCGRKFRLVDTGGIEPRTDDQILSFMREQAEIAIQHADVIIFLTDVKTGLTASDQEVANMLLRSRKPIVLAVNKMDSTGRVDPDFYEFYNLGLGDPIAVSAVHGHGTGDLLDACLQYFPPEDDEEEDEDVIKVAIIGKPNVGKSSLTNRILGTERMIVSNVAGTTRDAIDSYFENEQGKYVFIDTAGMRKKSKVDDMIERYSVLRATMAIDRADVCLIMIDAQEGVTEQDTKVAGLEWKNPVGTASGTFQYAAVRWFYDVSQLGAVCTKGASPVPWEGNPSPRTAESPAANINAVGLQNPGIDHYLAEDLPKLKAAGAFVISNVAGHCDDDYAAVVEKLADSDADMLEINVSCPNVSAGGMSVGTDPVALANLMDRLRPMTDKPMIVKLTPNVTDITVPARAAVEHGADALSMINTLKGMRINIRTGKPIIANVTGGVSGPAVLPVGLAAVYRVRTALPEIPIIGLGGIDSGEKALEYLYAGANAVEVGAAALFDPVAPLRVARELDDLLDSRPELAAKLAAGQTWR